MKYNKFIVFEGPHGVGKTTQAKLLKDYLDKHGIPSVYTKEPYLGDLKILIDKYSLTDNKISSYMLLYLHAADRFAHVEYIKKVVEYGKVVIADRYLLSSCVYQQIQGISIDLVEHVNFFCIEPDVTFIFTVPLSERKKRLNESKRSRNTLFFREENLMREEELYQKLFDRYEHKWKNVFLIDGRGSIYEIHNKIITQLEKL